MAQLNNDIESLCWLRSGLLLYLSRSFTNVMIGISAHNCSPLASISVRAQSNYSTVLSSATIGVLVCPPRSPQDQLAVVLFPNSLKKMSISVTCKFLLRFQYSASVCVKPGYRQYGLKTCFNTFCHEVISAVPIPISGQALGSLSSLPTESM